MLQLQGRVTVKAAFKICFPPVAAIFLCLLLLTYHRWNAEMLQKGRMGGSTGAVLSSIGSVPLKHRLVRLRLPAVCVNESCRSDYVSHLQPADARPIPAIRHILWRSELVSQHFAQQLLSWLQIHPDWTYVLWRDQDLEPFVAAHFPGLLAKFNSLPEQIIKVDMIRYMLLYQFGGTYADLDYKLVRGLDSFRRFHAVITREPEAHSLQLFGMSWPVRIMASPAFMMSAPGHAFLLFAIEKLRGRRLAGALDFAGPIGLTGFLEEYGALLPIATSAMETVYVPPSRCFYPYPDNRMLKIHKVHRDYRTLGIGAACRGFMSQDPTKRQQSSWRLTQYCADITNMDPITDGSEPVIAIHDLGHPETDARPGFHVVRLNAPKLCQAHCGKYVSLDRKSLVLSPSVALPIVRVVIKYFLQNSSATAKCWISAEEA